MTTVIYCRISLDVAGDRLGVERQERECRELCERNGWPVDKVLVDNDLSATTGVTRPAFEELLGMSRLDRIVTWHTDRLTRKATDLERVISLGVPVYTVTAGQLDLSTPAGRAVARTVTAWAAFEGEQRTLRQKASHRQRAEAGRPFWAHRRPFGYAAGGELEKGEADALRECYRKYRTGSTFADCARWLNDEGWRTTRGSRWNGSKLAKLMRDPRNAGILVYDDQQIGEGSWEPIISLSEWRAVMDRRRIYGPNRSSSGARVKGLLTGLVLCAECGDKFRQSWQHTTRNKVRVNVRTYRAPCMHVSVEADWLDELVTNRVLKAAQSPVWALRRGNVVEEGEAADAAAEAATERRKLDELLDLFVSGDLDGAAYRKAKGKIEARLSTLEVKAQAFYAGNPIEQAFGTASEAMKVWQQDGLELHHKREAIQMVFDGIVIRKRLGKGERVNESMVRFIEKA